MHNLEANYYKILEVLDTINIKSNFLNQKRKPRLTDKELIALNLTSEYLGIDSEYDLFRKLPETMNSRIERSVYNRRRRKLFPYIEEIRVKLAFSFNEFEECFIVDSMPLEVCKIARASRSKICKDTQYSNPDRGFCASQNTRYYGYKLHAVCSVRGIIQSMDISPASVHDIHYLKDIKQQLKQCTLLADKGYLSSKWQLNLFEEHQIKLETPMRKNQYDFKEQPYVFRKSRKRIETLFSQLCDQFMIRRNYAKPFEGFKTRILSKITALTLIQFINHFVIGRKINNIKNNII